MRFKSLLFALFLMSQIGYSQEKTEPKKNKLQLDSSFIVGFIYPIEFGNTALSKGHNANLGLTSTFGLLKYNKISAGIGLDMVIYSVKDKQIIGDYDNSKHNSYFGFVKYDYNLTNKISFSPNIGYGYSELVIRKNNKRRGAQDGTEFRLGTLISYNFNKQNALCFSIMYVNNTYDVKANESLQDFFSKSNSIQIGIVYRTQ